MTTKCYSLDDENFKYTELGDLFDELESEGRFLEGEVYYEADCKAIEAKDYAQYHTVYHLLEHLDEQLYEDVGEVADSAFTSVSEAARTEFRDFLEVWINKHVGLSGYWHIVSNSREMKVTKEDLV